MAILLCDDEMMNRKVASKILGKEGFNILEAKDALEAYDILEEHKIELILMDLMMPDIDGYEAIKHIRSQEKYLDIPIIILSALSSKEAIKKGLELGAKAYITKPFDVVYFAKLIKDTLKSPQND